MYDLRTFSLSDLVRLSTSLREVEHAESMEAAAEGIVRLFLERLVDKETGDRACALVRFYKTHRCSGLPSDLREFAEKRLGPTDDPESVRCLTLLATAGERPEWNDRSASIGHKAIPLVDAETVRKSPMIHQLLSQLGYPIDAIVDPADDLIIDLRPQTYNVFHIENAEGSPFVPAQDFVRAARVRSVLGLGGRLPDGELFALILFSRVPISRAVADLFRPLALTVTSVVLSRCRRVFAVDPDEGPEPDLTAWEALVLRQLLDVREATVLEQTLRLENALATLEDHATELAHSRQIMESSEARKAAVLETALDAIVTMDDDGRIVEFNPSAETMFGYSRNQAMGSPMADLLVPPALRRAHHQGIAHYRATGEGPILGKRVEVNAMHASGHEFPVELTVTRVMLPDHGLYTAYIRDLTSVKRTEAELRELADALQWSLLPPTPPRIPGVEVATRYRPATRGLIVGGDFFDVFAVGAGDWGLVMGDVCGKGAQAASLTALARYTIRGAAAYSSVPSAMLRALNDTLLGDDDELRFCSTAVVWMRLAGGAVTVTTSSGGHPPPLIVTAAGEVSRACPSGSLVGLFAQFEVADHTTTLHVGDVLALFTDGITEARSPDGELFGEERLGAIIAGVVDQPVEDIADRVLDAVLGFAGETTDDVALLLVKIPDSALPRLRPGLFRGPGLRPTQ